MDKESAIVQAEGLLAEFAPDAPAEVVPELSRAIRREDYEVIAQILREAQALAEIQGRTAAAIAREMRGANVSISFENHWNSHNTQTTNHNSSPLESVVMAIATAFVAIALATGLLGFLEARQPANRSPASIQEVGQ